MTSRPWIIALAASAVVNVFLIGGLAGLAYARLTAPPVVVAAPAPRVVAPPSPAPVVPVAPPDAPPKPTHHPVAPPPQPVVTLPPPVVTAPPLDNTPTAQARPPLISAGDVLSPDSRKAFRRALSTARALDLQARGNVEAALASYAASLTPQERAVLAGGLARVYTPAAARRMEGPN
jgi:uncharacterized membrane protein